MHLSVLLPILHINLGHPRQNERELIRCKHMETPLGNDLTGKVIMKEEKYDLVLFPGLPGSSSGSVTIEQRPTKTHSEVNSSNDFACDYMFGCMCVEQGIWKWELSDEALFRDVETNLPKPSHKGL